MSGEIRHEWDGTVLTVISDSGTSSADLKGPKGDTGPRGPQGPPGIIINGTGGGDPSIDLSEYATTEYVDNSINNLGLDDYADKTYVDNSINGLNINNYATKTYVATEIAQAQLSGGGSGDVDLSGYATKDDLNSYATKKEISNMATKDDLTGLATKDDIDSVITEDDLSNYATKEDLANLDVYSAEVDNQTIIADENGYYRTAIGGYANQGGGVDYKLHNIEFTPQGYWNGSWLYPGPVGNIGKPWNAGCLYHIKMTFKDGVTIEFDASFILKYNSLTGKPAGFEMVEEDNFRSIQNRVSTFYIGLTGGSLASCDDGEFGYSFKQLPEDEDENGRIKYTTCPDKWILTDIEIYAGDYVPIDGNYIPVDNETIILNDEGKLACTVSIGEGGSVDLNAYATKDYVNNKLTYSNIDLTANESPLTTGTFYFVYE